MQNKYYFTAQTNFLAAQARHVDKKLLCLFSPVPIPQPWWPLFLSSLWGAWWCLNNQKAKVIIWITQEAFRFQAGPRWVLPLPLADHWKGWTSGSILCLLLCYHQLYNFLVLLPPQRSFLMHSWKCLVKNGISGGTTSSLGTAHAGRIVDSESRGPVTGS